MADFRKCGTWGKYLAGDRVLYIKTQKIYRVIEYDRDHVPKGRIPIVPENKHERPLLVPIDDIERVKP